MKFILSRAIDAEQCSITEWYEKDVGEPVPENMLDNGADVPGFRVWFNKGERNEEYTWYRASDFLAVYKPQTEQQ